MPEYNNDATDFDRWLAKHWGEKPLEIERLLNNRTALRFLIAWSMFEGICFGGFMQLKKIDNFVNQLTSDTQFDICRYENLARRFHSRYQDTEKYANLMHRSNRNHRMEAALKERFDDLDNGDMMYLLLFSVFRYRNNIFHGNKGVHSWLKFEPQISWCLQAMQMLLTMYDVREDTEKNILAAG